MLPSVLIDFDTIALAVIALILGLWGLGGLAGGLLEWNRDPTHSPRDWWSPESAPPPPPAPPAPPTAVSPIEIHIVRERT